MLYRIILIMLLFLSCAYGKKRDRWMKERPVKRDAYIGIAMVEKKSFSSKEEWRQAAKNRALNDLVSEISIIIKGKTTLSMTDNDGQAKELYQEKVEAMTSANLKEYQFIDSWESRKEYWVYYELDKATWTRLEKERLDVGIKEVKSYLTMAQKFQEKGKIVEALKASIQAYDKTIPLLYQKPMVNSTPLNMVVGDHFSTLLSELHLKNSTPYYKGDRKGYSAKSSSVVATLQGKSVASLPILLDTTSLFSNHQGVFHVDKKHLSQKNRFSLIARVNSEKLIGETKNRELISRWCSHYNWPQTRLQFIFEKPLIMVSTTEENMGGQLSSDILEPNLRSSLEKGDYPFALNEIEANYTIMIQADTRPVGSFGNLSFVYLDITWSLVDRTGRELVQRKLNPIKGGGLDEESAGLKAYQKGKKLLADEILVWVNENL